MESSLLATLLVCLPFLLEAKPTLEVVLDSTQVNNPFGVDFDQAGNAYVAE